MKKVASISIFLILVLLTSILVTSVSNINKFIDDFEITEQETSRSKSKPTNQNILEEEEQHFNRNYVLLPIEVNVENVLFSFQASKMSLVHIEIITPPPLL